MLRRCLLWRAALVLLAAAPMAARQPVTQPLPDPDAFLAETRAHLKTDRELMSHYTFHEREAEVHVTKLGKVTTGPVKLYEVYPGLEPDDTYRRLIEVDGKPRNPAELEKDDRRHREKILKEIADREHETSEQRERRLRREEKRRHEEQDLLDDVLRVYSFKILERQILEGRPTIVFEFTPRSGAVPKTGNGALMKKVKGRTWISEPDYQVARVDVEMIDDLSVAGFLGKLYKGTTASFERRKINDEVWLPAQARFNGAGRALVRKFHIDTVVQYSDYRKFSVTTDTEFTLPKKGGGQR